MEPLDLDPDGYDGTYKMIGGRLSLDFINTVSWPGTNRQHDWLSSSANLDRWCDANRLRSMTHTDEADLEQVRRLRAEITAAVKPLAFDEHPAGRAIDALNVRIVEASTARRIDPDTLGWTWQEPTSILDRLAPIVLDTAELLTSATHDRLRHCDSCHWLFDDQSRNGRRRWCDMADCGSRAKSRSYYNRTKRADATTQPTRTARIAP